MRFSCRTAIVNVNRTAHIGNLNEVIYDNTTGVDREYHALDAAERLPSPQ